LVFARLTVAIFPAGLHGLRVESALWGLNPTGYHIVNLALHLINALLVWALLARLRVPGAALAGAIFALHPVQVESVAWITERKNVLMGLFFLSTLWCWIRFIDIPSRLRWMFYLLALVFYALALFSKTTACTLPAALLLICALRGERINLRCLGQVAPFFVFGLAMGAVTVWWERFHNGTRGALFSMGPIQRLLVASHAVWFYVGRLAWPAQLTFIYPRWNLERPSAYLWVLATLLALGLIYLLRKRLGRGVLIALIFFVATLSPLLGLIMLYTFRYTFVADHYQYLASIGPIALASAGIALVAKKRAPLRIVGWTTATLLLGILATLTWKQARMYSDIETLWRTTIQRSPESWMAYNNLGINFTEQGRVPEAIEAYRKTVALAPAYPEGHYNLANALLSSGDVSAALDQARTASSLQPRDPDAHVALGNAFAASHEDEKARKEFDEAIRLRSSHFEAQFNLASLLLQEGRADESMEHFHLALNQRPDSIKARVGLANALLGTRHPVEAIAQFATALRSAPNDLVAQCNLAWILATCPADEVRDGRKALALATQANEASAGDDPVVLRSLAAAKAETGGFEEAANIAKTALQRATEAGDARLCQTLQQEIDTYERGLPYRD
jgi:protein O-mannosyl-transferase